MSRWQRYWFADGGRLSAAIVRIGIALAVLGTLYRLATLSTVQIPGPPTLYRPVGFWMLFGHWVPGEGVVTALWVVAWGATGAMLVGLGTRIATAFSFIAAVGLASLSFASTAAWSHQYNVVFLAQCAFLGARGGDTLSLDAAIRRVRGFAAIDRPRAYQWSVRLVQLAVALMFAGAAFHKIVHGHGTLRWALSDNLRHQLLVRYDLIGLPRPALVDWIIDDVWRYRIAALLNLVSQLSPIFAVIFVRRPYVRLAGGLCFVIETLALGFVISLWNQHWLPLLVVFVDWEWLLRRPPSTPAPETWRAPRGPRVFVLAFFLYELVTAFIPTLDQRLNTYPFSSFPMFATIRATAPYDQHLAYRFAGDHYEVASDVPLTVDEQRWFDHGNRGVFEIRDPIALHARLDALLATARARYPEKHIHQIRHLLAIYEAPAYPTPARLDLHPVAITGEIRDDGTFRTLLGTLGPTSITVHPVGLGRPTALAYYADDAPSPVSIAAPLDADAIETGALPGDPIYVVATVDGVAWLVGKRGTPKL